MGSYYQERNTSHTVLSVFVVVFIAGVIIGLAFFGVEPLASAKNTVADFFAAPTSEQLPDGVITTDIKQTPVPSSLEPAPGNSGSTDIPKAPTAPTAEPQLQAQQNGPVVASSEKPPQINIPELENQIHNLINVERAKNGLTLVAWDDAISSVARRHSEDMAQRNYFNHISPEGKNAADRCRAAGVDISKYPLGTVYYLGCSENIFLCTLAKVYWYDRSGALVSTEYYTLSEIAELAVQGWMNSQSHRENILKSYWRTEGIGVAISANGEVYATENFN